MYDTCIAFVIDECPDAVSNESLDGFKVLGSRTRSSRSKSDEFQRCPDSMVIGSFFPGRSAEIRGSFVEWKVKAARPGVNLTVAVELTSSSSS